MADAIIQATPNTSGKPRVDFDQSNYDVLIVQKGYEVYHEKAFRCPCKVKGADNWTSCLSCGGTGWFFANKTRTSMVLQSMASRVNYKEWSQENHGQVTVTARDVEHLSYMDRIIVNTGIAYFNEIVYPIQLGTGVVIAKTIYDIVAIEAIFLFDSGDKPHIQLSFANGDYTISENVITLNTDLMTTYPQLSLTVRYSHRPVYHIVDLTREAMTTKIKNNSTGTDEDTTMPVHGIARRAHYLKDIMTATGSTITPGDLFDTNFEIDC